MANPLARVVMRNIVKNNSGAVKKSVNDSSSIVSLGSKEDSILKSILNRSSKSVTVETLSSLSTKKSVSSSNYESKPLPTGNAGAKGLGTLKTLDAISMGSKSIASNPASSSQSGYGDKPNYGKRANTVKSGGFKAVSIESLASGKNESKTITASNKVEPEKDGTQQGGMMSLNQLAGNKVSSSSNDVNPQNSERNKTSVRGSVMGNLSAYVPKVTLDSIGKKSSLF